MDRKACCFRRRKDFRLQRDRLGRLHVKKRRHSDAASMLIIKMHLKSTGVEHSEGAGQLDFIILLGGCAQRSNQNTRVGDAVELGSRSRGEPRRLKGATLA